MEISEDAQGNNVPDRYPVEHCRDILQMFYPPLLNSAMGAHTVFVIDAPAIWVPLPLEGPYFHYGNFPIQLSSPNQGLLLIILVCTNLFSRILHKV